MKSKFLMLAIAAMMMGGVSVDAFQPCGDIHDFGPAFQFAGRIPAPLSGYATRAGEGVRLSENGTVLTIITSMYSDDLSGDSIIHVLPEQEQRNVRVIRIFGNLGGLQNFMLRHTTLGGNVIVTFYGKNGRQAYRTSVQNIRNMHNANGLDNAIDAAI